MKILDLDFATDRLDDSEFTSLFELRANNEGGIDGLVAWFDVKLSKGVWLSTSPLAKETHWKQTIMTFPKPIQVRKRKIISLTMEVKP